MIRGNRVENDHKEKKKRKTVAMSSEPLVFFFLEALSFSTTFKKISRLELSLVKIPDTLKDP